MKKIKFIILGLLVCFLLFWAGSIAKCEILTHFHGTEFKTLYEQTNMLGDMDYLKVLDYSDTAARVYYVGVDREGGAVLDFVTENGRWKLSQWDVIWSKTGSADEFMWPYLR